VPDGRSVAALSLHTLASRVALYVSGFVGSVLVARSLGPADRGLYALPVAMVTVAGALGSQGLDLAQMRIWARGSFAQAELAAAARWLALGAGAIAAALTLGAYEAGRDGPFAHLPRQDVAIVVIVLPMWVHSTLSRGLLVMAGSIRVVNRALVAGDVTRTAAVIALVATGGLTVRAALALFALSVLVPWAIAARALRRTVPASRRRPPRALLGELTGLAAQLAPHGLFLTLLLRVDIVLLAHYRPLSDVGVYSVAVLIAELVWLPTWSLLQPMRQRQANAPAEEVAVVTARTVRMTAVLATATALSLALGASVLTRVLFGGGFADAVPAVWALLPASVAMAVWRPVSLALVRLAPGWMTASVSIGALAVNVAANVVLIPALGIAGAALASSIAYSVGAVASVWLLARRAGMRPASFRPTASELAELARAVRPSFVRRQVAALRSAR
jgi:O-antigen/teichoic acid export membrane protein